jgi:hypothetical protein
VGDTGATDLIAGGRRVKSSGSPPALRGLRAAESTTHVSNPPGLLRLKPRSERSHEWIWYGASNALAVVSKRRWSVGSAASGRSVAASSHLHPWRQSVSLECEHRGGMVSRINVTD